MQNSDNTKDNLLFHKLNQETAKISWPELQRHFARGAVVVVDSKLDLVKIAAQISENQEQAIKSLIDTNKIHRASDDDAILWNKHDQQFWAVVIAPWILVQEI